MKKFFPLNLTCLLLAAILPSLSCSDDKGTENNKDLIQAQYIPMKAMTDQTVIPLATAFVEAGMGRLDGVSAGDLGLGKAAAPDDDSIMIVYHPLSGWWEGYFATQSDPEGDPYTELVVRDSIQFKSISGNNQFEPNDSTDYVHDIPSLQLSIDNDSLNTTLDIFSRNDMIYDDLQSDTATIDGPMSMVLSMGIDTLGKSISSTISATLLFEDLQIPIPETAGAHVCPLSGVITYTLVENLTSQLVSDETINTTWSIRITIVDSETYLVKISAGNIVFDEYQLAPQYICSSDFLTEPLWKAWRQFSKR